jgi:shikimate kinase
MGAGKTAIGKRLAVRLDLPFVDADREIQAMAGCTITEMFKRHGEATFRDCEQKVIARLLDEPRHVLATGGGAFIGAATRALIARVGISIWLRADLDLLLRRTARRNTRPLLKEGNPRTILGRLIEERHPIYAEADIIVDSGDSPQDETVGRVLAALEAYKTQRESIS